METNVQENVTPITRRRGGRRAVAEVTSEGATPDSNATVQTPAVITPNWEKDCKSTRKMLDEVRSGYLAAKADNEKLTKENETLRLTLQQQRNYYSAVLANASNSIMNLRDQLTLADVNGR